MMMQDMRKMTASQRQRMQEKKAEAAAAMTERKQEAAQRVLDRTEHMDRDWLAPDEDNYNTELAYLLEHPTGEATMDNPQYADFVRTHNNALRAALESRDHYMTPEYDHQLTHEQLERRNLRGWLGEHYTREDDGF